jgi:DNA adenine methylase
MVSPILKWVGGKRQLTKEILKMLPTDSRNRAYHEPFFGSGAVFFKVKPRKGSINDINPRLMNFYRVVRDKPAELIEQASKYKYDKQTYYELRDHFNKASINEVEEASIFLYLNKTCYNGLYRVNSKGEFNVPFGRYKNPTIVRRERILSVSTALRTIGIHNEDFSYVSKLAEPGDVCYLDPPYEPVSETANFTSYSRQGFDSVEQNRLKETCIKLNKKGVKFILSNSYTEQIRELYADSDFRIEIVKARRAVNSKADGRGKVSEVLITNLVDGTLKRKELLLTSFT